jgi:CBS domain-containing protein
MAETVHEVMSRELFLVGRSDRPATVLAGLLGLGISSAPVLDAEGQPEGVVALRDLAKGGAASRIADIMSAPAAVIRESARITDAARLLATTGFRHLVVVDDTGRAVGMLSAVDIVRALIGEPAQHPHAFPHLDRRAALTWTDDTRLDEGKVDRAPDAPGVLVLLQDYPKMPRRIVWAEATGNVRTRLIDLLSLPQDDPELRIWLRDREHLQFRAAAVADSELRASVARTLTDEIKPFRVL